MMNPQWLLPLLLVAPALCAGLSLIMPSPRAAMRFTAAGTLGVAALGAFAALQAFRCGPLLAAGHWFLLDTLSAYHLLVMVGVFSLSAWQAVAYFGPEIEHGELSLAAARRYGGLWFGSLTAMTAVLTSNNLGILWVGVETSTLLTAFLICLHATPSALEAMWKYLIMCSVGVALAFAGTLLIAASTEPAGLGGTDALLWTNLRDAATRLNPRLFCAGFIFLAVGYGTKAGLAPMHNWLPDAHSQAPAPVSAMFSGFMLNAALYGILRCLPLAETVTGSGGWAREILVALGLLSMLVAAVFVTAQRDLKRLLAYSSVEHVGIMAVGIGLGGLGTFAALLHMLNHSICKSVAFLSAGRLSQQYGTLEIHRIAGSLRRSPCWGRGLLGALLALIGTAPFAIFLSEFLILVAAIEARAYWTAALFLVGLAVVFIGILRHAMNMAWKPQEPESPREPVPPLDWLAVFGPLTAVLVLGVWLPEPLARVLTAAARIIQGAP